MAIERAVMGGEGGAFYYSTEVVLLHFGRSRSRAARRNGEWRMSTVSTQSTVRTLL